jgi:CubicO group peptidase (beta-lactamase class C family)
MTGTTKGGRRGRLRRGVVYAGSVALLGALIWLAYEFIPREYFPTGTEDRKDRLTAYLDAVMESRPIPGLAVALVKDGKVLYARGFGVRQLGGQGEVTPATLFHTASVSKAMVATAAMLLVSDGRLDIDAPLTRYLPYFRLADGREAEVTARHVLSHTSGLPDVVDYGWETPQFDDDALERYVRSLAEDTHLLSDPGAEWKYSNMAFEVLGDAIAKIAGAPFEQTIDELILAPLDMRKSSFLPIVDPEGDQASPHRGALAPTTTSVYPYNRAHAPSSTLRSSALELAKFAAALLRDEETDAPAFLPDSVKGPLWQPHLRVDGDIRMGFGWFVRRHRGTKMAVAPGRDPGFNALLALLPDKGVGLVLLSNYDGQSSFELVEIADGVLDVGLGRSPRLPQTSIAVPIARVIGSDGVDAAITEYRRLKALDDGRYRFGMSDLITLGHDLRQTGRVEDAIRFYQLNAEEQPDYFGSHSALASAYMQLGDTDRAIESYRTVLSLRPERYGCPLSCYQDLRIEALMGEQ